MVNDRMKVSTVSSHMNSPSSVTNLLSVEPQESQEMCKQNTMTASARDLFKGGLKGALTVAKAVRKFKTKRKSIAGTATIDPLTWKEIPKMIWWPGILAIVTSYAIAPLITSLFFIGIGWQEYAIHKSRWWQCGVYCSALWLTSIQIFGFYCVQIKVRSQPGYDTYHPPKLKAILLYLSSAIFAFMVWAVC